MKYYELIGKANLANQIPLAYGEKKLSADSAAEVVLLKVHFNSALENMKESLDEVVKNLKKEGFDERSSAIEEMKKVDATLKAISEWEDGKSEGEKPKMPTEEEIAKAEETRKTEEDFNKELLELSEVYNKAANKQMFEDVDFKYGLSKDAWKNIYDMLGTDDEIDFIFANGTSKKIKTIQFIQFLGELIIE